MKQLQIQWTTPEGDLAAVLPISPGRQPESVPYVDMLSPVQGQRLAWLGSVRFQVVDLDSRPVNWTVDLDGTLHFEGRASPRSDPCPIVVEASLGDTRVSSGAHRLVLRATDGRVSETASVEFVLQPTAPELELKWTINTSSAFQGIFFGAGHQGCQTVWDIDSDGVDEIVFGTRRGDSNRLWCFDASRNLEWIYPPIDKDGLPGQPTSKVSLVDVNNDGTYELCLGGRGGRLHVLNPDGSICWTWDDPNVGSEIPGSHQALDVDGDGNVEFFLVDGTGFVHCVSHQGDLVWTSPKATGAGTGQPTICDLDLDGRYEVVWNPYHGDIYCTDAQTGNHKWIFEAHCNPPVIVADVNRDGKYEIVAWTDYSPEGAVLIVGPDGVELSRWTGASPGYIRLCQAMGDVDGDGSVDLAVTSDTGIFCVDIGRPTPVTKWMINITDWAADGLIPDGAVCSGYSSYQLIADIDGDDRQEILWLVPYPMVTDAATGTLEAYYFNEHIQVNTRPENGGWWGDVDEDGRSEWIVELDGKSHPQTQIYCLTLNGKFPADSCWPEYYHSAHPAEVQNHEDWLRLKSAYSNSLWFPMPETLFQSIAAMLAIATLWRIAHAPESSPHLTEKTEPLMTPGWKLRR